MEGVGKMGRRYYKSYITDLADGDVKFLEWAAMFYYRLALTLLILFTLVVIFNIILVYG